MGRKIVWTTWRSQCTAQLLDQNKVVLIRHKSNRIQVKPPSAHLIKFQYFIFIKQLNELRLFGQLSQVADLRTQLVRIANNAKKRKYLLFVPLILSWWYNACREKVIVSEKSNVLHIQLRSCTSWWVDNCSFGRCRHGI